MNEECIHELLRSSCSVCSPRQATLASATRSPAFGPWITASYDGCCAGCDGLICRGEQIRADGAGSWLCASCGAGQ